MVEHVLALAGGEASDDECGHPGVLGEQTVGGTPRPHWEPSAGHELGLSDLVAAPMLGGDFVNPVGECSGEQTPRQRGRVRASCTGASAK